MTNSRRRNTRRRNTRRRNTRRRNTRRRNTRRINTRNRNIRKNSRNIGKNFIGSGNSNFCEKNDCVILGVGDNKLGQIGSSKIKEYGTNKISNTIFNKSRVTKIFCGPYNTFFMCNNNDIYATGYNYTGQLGLSEKSCRGNKEKHDYIFEPRKVYTNKKTIKDIGCEISRTYFLDTEGTAWGVGVGLKGGIIHISDKDKKITTIGLFQKIRNGDKNFKSLYSGYSHTIFRTEDNSLYGIGKNNHKELNIEGLKFVPVLTHLDGEFDKKVTKMACGGYNSIIAYKDPNNNDGYIIFCMGSLLKNIKEKIQYNVTAIACSDNHLLIADDKKNLYGYCCNTNNGYDYKNQLGITNKDLIKKKSESDKKIILIKNFKNNIKKITCGELHSIILFDTGKVIAAGSNKYKTCDAVNKCWTKIKSVFGTDGWTSVNTQKIHSIASGNNHTFFLSTKIKPSKTTILGPGASDINFFNFFNAFNF